MIVVGLDVCKSSVVCCALAQLPTNAREFYYDCKFQSFPANPVGIKALLELGADMAVLEPTGVNYAKLWGTHLARNGVEVRLVEHRALRYYRKSHLQLPDKDDQADALALACYGFEYLHDTSRFLQIRDFTTTRIRELCLRLAHLNRVQNPIINRLRQDLAWQFPEVQNTHSVLLLNWLAGLKEAAKYDRLYKNTCGLGVSPSAQNHARRLVDLLWEEEAIEKELEALLGLPQFLPYLEVFTQFGFGLRVKSLILSQIYPFEAFLEDGKPIVKVSRGRVCGRPTAKHLSVRRFQKALGLAPSENSSGDTKKKSIVGGSDICRKAFWQWVFTRIEPAKSRPNTEACEHLVGLLEAEKAKGRPIKLIRIKVAAKASKMLFWNLYKELICDDE